MSRIAVLTICRNDLDSLKQTVASVCRQTQLPDEFIVVDGGSTDGTVEYLKSLNDITHWISERDRGISDAFNKAAKLASTDWVIFLNAGDRFADDRILEEICPYLQTASSEIAAVSGYIHLIDERGVKRAEILSQIEHLDAACTVAHQGSFIRKSVQEAFPYDLRIRTGMDYDFWLRVLKTYKLFRIDRKIANCSWGGISTSPSWQEHQFLFNQLIRWLNSDHKKISFGMFARFFWQSFIFKVKLSIKISLNSFTLMFSSSKA